jgi:hypothetical protein
MIRQQVRALRVPFDRAEVCSVVEVALSGAAFSQQIGGGLLDEAHIGTAPDGAYTVYAALSRWPESGQSPVANERAVLLAARLGWAHLVDRAGLFGDVLLVGLNERGDDTDLPESILDVARRLGLLPSPPVANVAALTSAGEGSRLRPAAVEFRGVGQCPRRDG